MANKKSVAAVIPVFNEERSVSEVVRAARRFVKETVVVDDGSMDRTTVVARKAGARVVQNEYGHGAHLAILYGIEQGS